ncbi:hypothetical protein G7Y89_g3807 [Cudoniella acicularis]|uniref:Uncharacterized protein n=1 Tax=Cudoniella acicularis TaxID=354080 RepID=A0A8H4W5L1_9HELO|nr:hypothetical protein G7Y89_g3807 [Cudoniella acicularis]
MSGTQESVAQQNAAVLEALNAVTIATELFRSVSTENAGVIDIHASRIVGEAHSALMTSAVKLVNVIRGPTGSVWAHLENVAYTGAIRALLEMGAFNALPLDGSMVEVQNLGEELQVKEAEVEIGNEIVEPDAEAEVEVGNGIVEPDAEADIDADMDVGEESAIMEVATEEIIRRVAPKALSISS